MSKRKLSASALSNFLKSPKLFYWRHIANLEPITLSVANWDHDRLAGICWSAFVARFYTGISEQDNTAQLLKEWEDGTEGWVPPKARERLTEALKAWAAGYYQQFSPSDGCRIQSEMLVENNRFIGYLDGWNQETRTIHEVKSTSRSPQLSEQLWKVQNSIQVKLYCVLAQAKGICIEFAFKDPPCAIFRATAEPVTEEQLKTWEQELNALADSIYSLGDNPNNYPCHPDGCCITSKNFTAMCQYQALCSGLIGAEIGFKLREHRR